MEYRIDGVTRAEFQAVVALELFTLYSFAVDERAMLAALVLDKKLSVLGNYDRMVAGDPGIGDDQVFLHLAANAKRTVVEVESSLLAALDENQAGKNSGAQTGNRADNGLGRHEGAD